MEHVDKSIRNKDLSGRSGWLLMAVLAPQVVLGLYLAAVPDQVFFSVTQLVVLLHVIFGLLTLPAIGFWLFAHIRTRRFVRTQSAGGYSLTHLGVAAALGLSTLAAIGSGFPLMWSGAGMPLADWHAVLGAVPIVLLCAHLVHAKRKLAATMGAIVLVFVLVDWLVFPVVAHIVPPAPETPPMVLATRTSNLYDSAVWCAECHQEVYDEWKDSTHAKALEGEKVREIFTFELENQGVERVDSDFAAQPGSGVCAECHAPISYYGNDEAPILEAEAPVNEGVTCSFCHTLRGANFLEAVKREEDPEERPDLHLGPFRAVVHPERDFDQRYISAPETVRRYWGQASENPALRTLGNLLIRWRPEMHRQDYHVSFLDQSEACGACHHRAIASWKQSQFARGKGGGDPVACQDCHMVREMTGEPRMEPGKYVPWGPVRGQRRSHRFLGGNVEAMRRFENPDGEERERAFARSAVKLSIVGIERKSDRVAVRVRVEPWLVGHVFPVMEFEGHVAYVQLSFLDADGGTLLSTSAPKEGLYDQGFWEGEAPTYKNSLPEWPGKLLYNPDHGDSAENTAIPADGVGEYELALPVSAALAHVDRVQVTLFQTFDIKPIATAEAPMKSDVRSP